MRRFFHKGKDPVSFWFACTVSLVILLLHIYLRKYYYNNWSNMLSWDITSYYLYLPLTFIYHDIGMKDFAVFQNLFDTYKFSGTFYQVFQLDNGNWIMNYTCGWSYAYAPFFFIAHLWAKLGGYPADGFSFPYQFCIANGVMIYIIAGIFVLRKVLLNFFSDKVTFLTMVFMILATNYFHESINDELQPHAMLFTLYALLIWFTIQWHKNQKTKNAIGLAAVMAFSILARPSEILMLLIPVLWNVFDRPSLVQKLNLIRQNMKQVLLMIICGLIIVTPQLIYWKLNTGDFVFFSYKNTEGFDFLRPHILKVLFSFKKSWFVYTPFIVFPIISIFLLRKNHRPIYLAILLFFLANFYLLSSWAAWWNGGSFGMRYFVQSYAVMAIPFGFMVQDILKSKFARITLLTIFSLLMTLNLFQTWQYVNWIIPPDRMTKEYYKAIFLKTNVPDKDRELMEIERKFETVDQFINKEQYRRKVIGALDYDTLNAIFIDEKYLDTTHYLSPPHSCRLNKDQPYSPAFRMPFNVITSADHAWIRITFSFFPIHDLKTNNAALVVDMEHDKRKEYKYHAFGLDQHPYELNKWNKVSFDYLTPFPYRESDELKIYFWLLGEKDIYIDDVIIEAYEKK